MKQRAFAIVAVVGVVVVVVFFRSGITILVSINSSILVIAGIFASGTGLCTRWRTCPWQSGARWQHDMRNGITRIVITCSDFLLAKERTRSHGFVFTFVGEPQCVKEGTHLKR